MYRIAICDDEEIFLHSLSSEVEKIMQALKVPYELAGFQSGEALLRTILREEVPYDMLLLDILMGDVNGIDLARRIREKDTEVAIVFITSSAEFSLKGYDVQALHYLLKPANPEKLSALLRQDCLQKQTSHYVAVKQGKTLRRIPTSHINFLETAGRKVAIHLSGETVFYTGKLADLEVSLPQKEYVRCHQSFLINLRSVAEITRTDAVMNGGARVPISRSYLPRVQGAFLDYLGSH